MRSLLIGTLLAISVLAAASFEAAAIKPADPDATGSSSQSDGSVLAMRNVTLRRCIQNAWGIQESRILDGPKWVDTNHFNIDARAEHKVDGAEFRMMLQSLLAERFHLTLHPETRVVPGYVLLLAKNGIKAKPTPADTPANKLGSFYGSRGRTDVQGATMEQVAIQLVRILGVPVMDGTELPGHFDFSLQWSPENGQAGASDPSLPDSPSIFTALQEQVGLKLETRKISVDMLIIDHVELPSEN